MEITKQRYFIKSTFDLVELWSCCFIKDWTVVCHTCSAALPQTGSSADVLYALGRFYCEQVFLKSNTVAESGC